MFRYQHYLVIIGILNKASDAKIMTELSKYKEELDLYKLSKTAENINFLDESLTAGKTNLFYNTQKSEENGNIKNVIPDISNIYFEQMEIIKGDLLLNTKDKSLIKIAQSLNIQVNPYDIVDGRLLSSYENLLLVDNNGTLTIPDSVTKIGEGAFSNVEGLKTIIIPGTVKEIEKNAFMGNSTLETVIMKDGVEKIKHSAFRECKNLKKVVMPNSVVELESQVFYGDTNLSDINISTGLTSIPSYAYCNCKKITNIEIPENVISIYDSAFSGCTDLAEISFHKNLKYIGLDVFYNTPSLSTLNIDSDNDLYKFENGILIGLDKGDIVLILSDAVSGDTFTVPDGVKILNSDLLNNYTTITKVNISASVTSINASFLNYRITRSHNR